MKKKINLLITCIGGTTARSLIREIKKSNIYQYRVVGVDAERNTSSDRNIDASYIVPKGGAKEYVGSLLAICRQENINFILPGSDEEALAISNSRHLFEEINIHPIVSDKKCLTTITDKLATYQKLEQSGVRVPEYKVVESGTELKNALYEYGYPEHTVISKPALGRGGRGLYVYKGKDPIPSWLGKGKRENRVKLENFSDNICDIAVSGKTLVMPMLDAPAYDADVVAKSGSVEVIVVRKRNNPAGIPFTGNTVYKDGSIVAYCTAIASALNLDSLHDIDLMTDAEGNTLVIEVNPRPSGSMVAALVAGVPVVDIAIQSILGEEVNEKVTSIQNINSNVEVINKNGEICLL